MIECEVQNIGSIYENSQVTFTDGEGESKWGEEEGIAIGVS